MALSEKERIALVLEHLRAENAHNVDATMRTFGKEPSIVFNSEPYRGHESVRALYEDLFRAFPDFRVEVKQQHVSDQAVIIELVNKGTHTGSWLGVPATGRPIEVSLCIIYTFDESEKLAGERVYYDEALMLRQLGILPQPGGA